MTGEDAYWAGLGPDDFCGEDIEDDYCECGGDGWITDDCFEDTCCCLDPDTQHGVIPCPTCKGGA